MKMRVFVTCMAWAVFLTASSSRARAATIVAPSSLVDRTYTISETNGNSVMSFLQTNLYKWTRATGLIETGFFFAKRATNTWNVAATKVDGTLTTQIAFQFASATNGIVTLTVAGEARKTGTFFEGVDTTPPPPPPVTNFAPAALEFVKIQNVTSITGPSAYTIHFTGATNGTFSIEFPGWGSGTFVYTPATNAAHLVLTYTGDLAGDYDDLNLEFKGRSESSTNSLQSGVQSVSGTVYPVEGTFTFKAAVP